VRLLGAECVLTGINPSIALTMQTMGVNLSDIVTLRSLRDALQYYIGRDVDGEGGARRRRLARARQRVSRFDR
jgi:rsbT co-antagonist protein RsbR